jgi:hypothetical protein
MADSGQNNDPRRRPLLGSRLLKSGITLRDRVVSVMGMFRQQSSNRPDWRILLAQLEAGGYPSGDTDMQCQKAESRPSGASIKRSFSRFGTP